jgi:site-specific DNA-methyltransferase (adenine-specific)
MNTARSLALYEDDTATWGLIEADALMLLAKLPDSCVDAIVTDPPYGIAFGNEAWDGRDIHRAVSAEGEHLSAAEAFERWTQIWATEAARVLKPGGYMVALGAPRTFHRLTSAVEDVGLEIRDVLMWVYAQGLPKSRRLPGGLGTALKPAYEPILLARSRFTETTSRNLDAWGTGALNIEAARATNPKTPTEYWPANLALTHTENCSDTVCAPECPVTLIDRQRENLSRLFYCAKTTRREREAGCEQLPVQAVRLYNGHHHPPRVVANLHPTVKPIELMRWLVRLITPPGGLVLDPFVGSGTTGAAAVLEDRLFLGVEREPKYVDVACARITHWAREAAQGPT